MLFNDVQRLFYMPTEFVGLRLPSELVATVDRMATEQGLTRTAVITAAIRKGLGLPSGVPLEQRLTSVEQRLTNVEETVKQGKTSVKQNVKQRKTPVKQNVEQRKTAFNAAPDDSHPVADGGRWLTTSQAAARSAGRGGPAVISTLKRKGGNGELEPFGLRYCPHGSRSNKLATFEDVWFPPAEPPE